MSASWQFEQECACTGSSLHGITYCPLHAAAPTLLEALEMMPDDGVFMDPVSREAFCERRRAAIRAAKAAS
jgi:hypothetical protein